MVRRISCFLVILTLLFAFAPLFVFARETDNIKDDMNYLSPTELDEIQALIDSTVQQYQLDIAIMITDSTGGKSSRDFADDYYDTHGYGVGSDGSGLLMLVNMSEREVWISTTGKAIDIFTDSRISEMTERIAGYLSEGDFYNACKVFIRDVGFYADRGTPPGQHRAENQTPGIMEGPLRDSIRTAQSTYLQRVVRIMQSPLLYVMALAIAILSTAIASSSNKGKGSTNHQTYEEKGSFQLTANRDDYIRETTTRVKITNDSASGSNVSSTHRSSSGRSHGGGGRKF